MTVEEYIVEGVCYDCDCDVCKCFNQGYCEYDGKEEDEDVTQ